jgi:acyl-CoA hydrolase
LAEKVHGGAVMKWIDQAGYVCAVGWSGYYCVTAYVGGIRFYKPVFIGQLVEVKATVVHTGTSSMHIVVDVSASDPETGTQKLTTRCLIVFVAVDEGGDTVPVPKWSPDSEQEKRLEQYAIHMAKLRKDGDAELLSMPSWPGWKPRCPSRPQSEALPSSSKSLGTVTRDSASDRNTFLYISFQSGLSTVQRLG